MIASLNSISSDVVSAPSVPLVANGGVVPVTSGGVASMVKVVEAVLVRASESSTSRWIEMATSVGKPAICAHGTTGVAPTASSNCPSLSKSQR